MADTDKKGVDYSNLIRAQTRQVDIDAFKERGMKKVNVINARKINELISQAVSNIIGKMEDADIQTIKEDKAQIVMESMSEFKRLFTEQKKEKEEQEKLKAELGQMREALSKQSTEAGAAASASSAQITDLKDEMADLKAFMVNQASKSQASEMTRQAMLEHQEEILRDHFKELTDKLADSGNASAQAAVSEEKTQKALEDAVDKMAKLLEDQDAKRNGATTDALMKAITELKDDLGKRFDGLADAISGSKDESASDLKAEIAALRDDLAEKTVAASAANTEALQAQMAKMQEMLESGGGGGGGNIDLSELANKLEGSLSKKLAAAGIGKEEVSMDDSMAASGVMLGAAFKDMDGMESNLEGMSAKKSVDKSGGKKAKGALDALKKMKGKK